jgi:hypothetical protein
VILNEIAEIFSKKIVFWLMEGFTHSAVIEEIYRLYIEFKKQHILFQNAENYNIAV